MTQQAAVAEVAPESVTGTVVRTWDDHPAVRSMVIALGTEVQAKGPSDNSFVLGLLEQILAADGFDEIFAAQESGGSTSGQDFTMVPFLLKGEDIQFMQSRIGDFPFYALLTVTELQSGEQRAVNCGGQTFVTVLYGLREKGYFTTEKGCPEEGRSLMIKATPTSEEKAYLSLLPFAGAAKPAATARAKK